jgi:hypothetical protein
VVYTGDSRNHLFFSNFEREIEEWDVTRVPVPMIIGNLGMTFPTDFPNACAYKMDTVYLVAQMQRRVAEAQVEVVKAIARMQLRPVLVAPTAGVYDDVPRMVAKCFDMPQDMLYVSMDCLPMGEVVGTSKLVLKHTYCQDGLLKEAHRMKDGDLMVLVGMPPHHREEEMVQKMEMEFDMGVLLLSPNMAKKKVDEWVQVLRMDLPVGALKAWGMQDRFSRAHTAPLKEPHTRCMVIYVKKTVMTVLEASAEEEEKKRKGKEPGKAAKKSKSKSKKQTRTCDKEMEGESEEGEQGGWEIDDDEWVMAGGGYTCYSNKTGAMYTWAMN